LRLLSQLSVWKVTLHTTCGTRYCLFICFLFFCFGKFHVQLNPRWWHSMMLSVPSSLWTTRECRTTPRVVGSLDVQPDADSLSEDGRDVRTSIEFVNEDQVVTSSFPLDRNSLWLFLLPRWQVRPHLPHLLMRQGVRCSLVRYVVGSLVGSFGLLLQRTNIRTNERTKRLPTEMMRSVGHCSAALSRPLKCAMSNDR